MSYTKTARALTSYFERLADRHGLGEVIDAYYFFDEKGDNFAATAAMGVIRGRQEEEEE